MVTQSDLVPSWRFLQDVAANGGQAAGLESSGRVFRSKPEANDLARRCSQRLGGASRRCQFHKRRQLLIRSRNETFSVVAVRINNPDRLPLAIHSCNTTPKSNRLC
jgi:hypothetical protein